MFRFQSNTRAICTGAVLAMSLTVALATLADRSIKWRHGQINRCLGSAHQLDHGLVNPPRLVASHALSIIPIADLWLQEDRESDGDQERLKNQDDQAGLGSQQRQSEQTTADITADIEGEFVLPPEVDWQVDWTRFEPSILEQVQFKQPPYPADWGDRTAEERRAWLQEFFASDEGKRFQAEQQALLDERKEFPIDLAPDGTFITYDVPTGNYQLRGQLDVVVDGGKQYRLEAVGELTVGEVEQVALGKIEVMATRLFKPGDTAPAFKVDALQDGDIALADFQGKHVLLAFWGTTFPSSEMMMDQLNQVHKQVAAKRDLEILSISLDSQKQAALSFVKQRDFDWPQAHAGGWEHPMVKAYSVRSVPFLVLVDPQGEFELTNEQFKERFRSSGSLVDILENHFEAAGKAEKPGSGDGSNLR